MSKKKRAKQSVDNPDAAQAFAVSLRVWRDLSHNARRLLAVLEHERTGHARCWAVGLFEAAALAEISEVDLLAVLQDLRSAHVLDLFFVAIEGVALVVVAPWRFRAEITAEVLEQLNAGAATEAA